MGGKSRGVLVVVVGTVALLGNAACTAAFMKGSEPAKQPPTNTLAVFGAPRCTTGDGQVIAGSSESYVLAAERGTLVLYELDARGHGTKITNHWQDEEGHHFVTYVPRAQGWHYVIPDEPGLSGMRHVHLAGSYSVETEQRAFRLQGTPAASCPLLLQGQPVGPAPSGMVSAPPEAPARTCAPGSTQFCYGPGACQGAQQCLADGSAWGFCDCGAK